MQKSKSLAGIIGPTLVVMVVSELKVWNPDLYDSQTATLVYLSGILFFVAGISIVRVHNLWIAGWQVCLTIAGWGGMLLGLIRMFFPHAYKAQFSNGLSDLIVEIFLILLGIFLTFKAYWPEKTYKD